VSKTIAIKPKHQQIMTHRAKPMKGIVLAGGTGTRLHPLTLGVSKQLMPIYNKPMIYYPIATLVSSGIQEILLITTPQDASLFKTLLGDGSAWGIRFTYLTQSKPEGIAQALVLAEAFLDGAPAALILGDNLFHGKGLSDLLRQEINPRGATIFGYTVNDPERYGVIAFDEQMNPVDLIEKPSDPPSAYAVPGIYFYNSEAPSRARALVSWARAAAGQTAAAAAGSSIRNSANKEPTQNSKNQTPNTKPQIPNTNPQTPDTKHQIPNTKH
jgi:glucose-1-phosphate thymidylyltransferase